MLNPLTCLGDALDILRHWSQCALPRRRRAAAPAHEEFYDALVSPFPRGPLAFSFFLTACGEDEASARQSRGGPHPVVAEPATLEAERLRLEAVGTSQARRSVELFAETTGDVARSPSPMGTSSRKGASCSARGGG